MTDDRRGYSQPAQRGLCAPWSCCAKRVDLDRRRPSAVGAELEPAADMFLVYLRVFAEKCGLLDFLKLFVFSLASRKPPGEAAAATPEDDNLEVGCAREREKKTLLRKPG